MHFVRMCSVLHAMWRNALRLMGRFYKARKLTHLNLISWKLLCTMIGSFLYGAQRRQQCAQIVIAIDICCCKNSLNTSTGCMVKMASVQIWVGYFRPHINVYETFNFLPSSFVLDCFFWYQIVRNQILYRNIYFKSKTY